MRDTKGISPLGQKKIESPKSMGYTWESLSLSSSPPLPSLSPPSPQPRLAIPSAYSGTTPVGASATRPHGSLVPICLSPSSSLPLSPLICPFLSLYCFKLTTPLWSTTTKVNWGARVGRRDSEDFNWWEGCLSATEVLQMAAIGRTWGSTAEQWRNAILQLLPRPILGSNDSPQPPLCNVILHSWRNYSNRRHVFPYKLAKLW